jgi:hypothetical protein
MAQPEQPGRWQTFRTRIQQPGSWSWTSTSRQPQQARSRFSPVHSEALKRMREIRGVKANDALLLEYRSQASAHEK